MRRDPFTLDDLRPLTRWAIEHIVNAPAFRRLRSDVDLQARDPFDRAVLRALGITVDVAEADVAQIPVSGPLVVAANHPHGALDGLVLADVVRRARPDVRLLANYVLARVPEMHDMCFFIDPFGGPEAAARSRAGLRAAHLWLRRGGSLVVFPAGEVAHRRGAAGPLDSQWKDTFLRLALATNARIAPAWIEGSNSEWFYAAGRLHPSLRTAGLARELLKARGRSVAVRVGAPITVDGCPDAATVRAHVHALGDPIASEVARLPADARLAVSGSLEVYCTDASRIPRTLAEIGRLREIAFHAVGEGTGRSVDLDRFDQSYLHLFVWDRARQAVAGAYRLGCVDRLVREHGIDGLYTRTLFQYDERLLARLGGSALELGRSFVRPEYQKQSNTLLLLWRGVGEFVNRNPQYTLLFGPVSISARYSDTSHRLLIEFLRQNHFDRDLAQLVVALNPTSAASAASSAVPATADAVNDLIARSESDGKGMPVLLRQYLKLNARLLGFNVDPAFGDALDALMIVDLAAVHPAILTRYMGRAGAATFLAHHGRRASPRAA